MYWSLDRQTKISLGRIVQWTEKSSNNYLCLLHTGSYMINILSPYGSKHIWIGKVIFSLMRISDPDALKLLSFSVPSVISIYFSVFLGYIKYVNTLERWSTCGPPRYSLKRYLIWNLDVFQAKACKKTIPKVSFISK